MDSGRRYPKNFGNTLSTPDNNLGANLQRRNALLDLPFMKNTAMNGQSQATAYYKNGQYETIYSGVALGVIYFPYIIVDGTPWLLAETLNASAGCMFYKTGYAAFAGMPGFDPRRANHKIVPVFNTGAVFLAESGNETKLCVINVGNNRSFELSVDNLTEYPVPFLYDTGTGTITANMMMSNLAYLKPTNYGVVTTQDFVAFGYYYSGANLASALFEYQIPEGYYRNTDYSFGENTVSIEYLGAPTPVVSSPAYDVSLSEFMHLYEEAIYLSHATVTTSDALVYYAEYQQYKTEPIYWGPVSPYGGDYGYPFVGRIRRINRDTLAVSEVIDFQTLFSDNFTMHRNTAAVHDPVVNLHEHNGKVFVTITAVLMHANVVLSTGYIPPPDPEDYEIDFSSGVYERVLLVLSIEELTTTVLRAEVIDTLTGVSNQIWYGGGPYNGATTNALSLNDDVVYFFHYVNDTDTTPNRTVVRAYRYDYSDLTTTVFEVAYTDNLLTRAETGYSETSPPLVSLLSPGKMLMVGVGRNDADDATNTLRPFTASVSAGAETFALAPAAKKELTEVVFEGTGTTTTPSYISTSGGIVILGAEPAWADLHPETVL